MSSNSLSKKIMLIALLSGALMNLGDYNRPAIRKKAKKIVKKALKPATGMPNFGQTVIVSTKYNTERRCIYTHLRFWVQRANAFYSFSNHEVISWRAL